MKLAKCAIHMWLQMKPAFEADGKLFQCCRLPFGVTNGVAAFKRTMDDFIKRHALKNVYAYLDDLTVTGASAEEHQENLQRFLARP